MRARRTQVERSEETRNRILSAAIQVMIRRGYAGFRIGEVVDIAGLSRGAQLHHFGTKDVLIAAALTQVFALAREETNKKVAEFRSAGTLEIEDLISAIAEDAEAFFFNWNFLFALDMSMAAGKDLKIAKTARDIINREGTPTEDVWVSLLEEAGLEIDDARDVLSLLRSVIRGLAIRGLVRDDPARKDRVIELARRFTVEHSKQLLANRAPARVRP